MCCWAIKPMRHNYWTCTLEPVSHSYSACVPQLLKPTRPRAHALQLLSPCAATTKVHVPRAHGPQQEKPPQWEARAPQWRVAPARHNWRKPAHSNKHPTQPEKPTTTTKNKKSPIVLEALARTIEQLGKKKKEKASKWERKKETVTTCRWHDLIHRKFWRLHQKTVRIKKFNKVSGYKINRYKSITKFRIPYELSEKKNKANNPIYNSIKNNKILRNNFH